MVGRIFLWTMVVICCLQTRPVSAQSLRVQPKSPKEALRTFKLVDGYRIELVAAEPLIRDPVAIAFDARGRMYVVEYPEFNNYSFRQGVKVTSSVKRLADSNGDGKFDHATTFLDKIPMATAIACYNGGVFVGAAPDVFFCKDTTGDGKADVKEKVLTGFGRDFAGGGLLNSFHWGMDNRIHIATGFAGGRVVTLAQRNRPISVRASGLKFDPRQRSIAATSGGGQHGLAMDDWGNKFLCSNVNPIQQLMYDNRYTRRNLFFAPLAPAVNANAHPARMKLYRISPHEPWRVIRSKRIANTEDEGSAPGGLFTSASGITVFRGDAWAYPDRGTLFVGEVANNLVYRAQLRHHGVGWKAHRIDKRREFLASTDIWFRPVQFANGPDGNLYIVDMYRELIEGAAFVPRDVLKKLDPASGTKKGRIYRVVTMFRAQHRRRVNLAKLSTPQLVATLEHDNGWHRDTAGRLLYERRDPKSIEPLRHLVRKSERPLAVAYALHALRGIGRLRVEDLLPHVGSKHPQLAVTAVRLAESFVDKVTEVDRRLIALATKLTRTPRDITLRAQLLRYQLAFTLGYGTFPQHRAALLQILKTEGKDQWVRVAVQSSLSRFAGDALLELVQDKAFRASPHGRVFLRSLALQVGARNDASEITKFVTAVKSLPAGDETRQALTDGFLAYARSSVRQRLNDGKALQGFAAAQIKQALIDARNEQLTLSARQRSIRILSLASFSQTRELFGELLISRKEGLQRASLNTLATLTDDAVAGLILEKGWPVFSPELRRRAVAVLLSRTNWSKQLLSHVAQGRIQPAVIPQANFEALATGSDRSLRGQAKSILAKIRRGSRAAVIKQYASALKLTGLIGRGEKVFQANCRTCHRRTDMRVVGGDLRDQAQRPPEVILVHILDPNRNVKPRYVSYVVEKKGGQLLTGLITNETATSFQVQQLDGKLETVLRVNVAALRTNGKSFMPEGLEKKISPQQMADLIAYLRQGLK